MLSVFTCPFDVTPEMAADAILAAEALGRARRRS
jgi:hypothetical protein